MIWHADFGVVALPFPEGTTSGGVFDHDYCEALSLNNRNSRKGLVQAVGYCSVAGRKRAMLWNIITALNSF